MVSGILSDVLYNVLLLYLTNVFSLSSACQDVILFRFVFVFYLKTQTHKQLKTHKKSSSARPLGNQRRHHREILSHLTVEHHGLLRKSRYF